MQLFAMLSNPELFFIVSGPPFESKNSGDDIAVVRLLDDDKDRKKMLTIKFHRKEGSTRARSRAISSSPTKTTARWPSSRISRRDDAWRTTTWAFGCSTSTTKATAVSSGIEESSADHCYALLKNMHGQKYFRSH